MKSLLEELRISKERIKQLEKKLRNEEKTNLNQHEQLVKLEEHLRDMKHGAQRKKALDIEAAKPYHVINDV